MTPNPIVEPKIEAKPQEEHRMRMSFEKPPVYDLIVSRWHINPERTVFTYGDILFNPSRLNIDEPLMAHEQTHAAQQNWNAKDAANWWARYLEDPYFRIDQEAEAYAIQYLFFRKYVNHDRNQAARFLYQLASSLSGPTYGNVIGQMEAQRLIQKYAAKVHV